MSPTEVDSLRFQGKKSLFGHLLSAFSNFMISMMRRRHFKFKTFFSFFLSKNSIKKLNGGGEEQGETL